ncbi:MAG: hypothetical protein E7069_09975 [Bacteroidales bacterium]|jgi:hypothetical protein|nr:hypothetical protein [Bacteroidales bacterium]
MSLFFELLQISLGTRDRFSRGPSVVEWQELFNEAQRQAVIGLLMIGVERLPNDQRPPRDVMLKWIGLTMTVEQISQMQQKRATELTEKVRELGFRSCVLKGVGIAQLYPNSLRRQGGDIDLWVDGERQGVLPKLSTQYNIGKTFSHHTDVEFFDDVKVEIHFRPSWLYNPVFNCRLQRFFERKKYEAMQARAIGYNYPSVEFDAVYSLAHTFHHLLEEGVGFRHVIDYYYIIQNLPNEERPKTLTAINSVGLGKFLSAMMYVLTEALGIDRKYLLCAPNAKEGNFLLNEISNAGNFGKQRKGGELKRNSFKRYSVVVLHYPNHVLWMIPWKIWHLLWRTWQSAKRVCC